MSEEHFTRRTLLDSAIRIAALPAGMAFLSAWASAAQEHNHPAAAPEDSQWANYQPTFFSAEDFKALEKFTEVLIPTDETPGAREAHCACFIDFLLHSMNGFAPDTQERWRDAMRALETAGFHAASDENSRVALVNDMSKPERDHSAHHPAYKAYQLIKRENTFAFYTARAGSIEALDYRGNTYNIQFPACTHPEHQTI